MEPAGVERKLTSILGADVAGYSRVMGEDEEGTLNHSKHSPLPAYNPKYVLGAPVMPDIDQIRNMSRERQIQFWHNALLVRPGNGALVTKVAHTSGSTDTLRFPGNQRRWERIVRIRIKEDRHGLKACSMYALSGTPHQLSAYDQYGQRTAVFYN